MTTRRPFSDDFAFRDADSAPCVLAAAGLCDVGRLRKWCARLPRDAYGNIFIADEVPHDDAELPVPEGVGVTRIARKQLPSALDAWMSEWLRANPRCGRDVRLWSGARTDAEMETFWSCVESELGVAWSGRQLPPGVTGRAAPTPWLVPVDASALADGEA